jgi:RNA polymerase sigma factor (sigma-70 family)
MTKQTIPDDLADFCRSEWPRLVGSMGLFVRDAALSEDIAQETLLRVAERWRKVRETESPSAWAHRVAFNLAKSHFRHRGVHQRLMPRVAMSDRTEGPDVEARVDVLEALDGLPQAQRGALILRFFADLSVHEAALALSCPDNTVKTNTRRGLLALRGALGAIDLPEPEERLR